MTAAPLVTGDWSGQRERGSLWLVRTMIWLSRRLGWHFGHALLFPITLYFFLWSRGARGISRRYLTRALGRQARAADVFRHFFVFSSVILDRIFLLTGSVRPYRVRLLGLAHLQSCIARGGGCVLLGSHLGSFEILRVVAARDCPVPFKALMYRGHTAALTGLIERLNPALCNDLIEIGSPDAMLAVRDCVARGEIVGILADRAPDSHKQLTVRFFDGDAAFPTGPIIVAATLGAPVVLFFAVRVGRRRYDVHFEPFAEAVILGRQTRQEDLRRHVARFAARLEAQCRAHPYNWFNFYDFWGSARPELAMPDRHCSGAARPVLRAAGPGPAALPRSADGQPGRGAVEPGLVP